MPARRKMTPEHRPPTAAQETTVKNVPFEEKFALNWRRKRFLCLGLDSDPAKIPLSYKNGYNTTTAIVEFNKSRIKAAAPYIGTIKPNSAFYEEHGAKGLSALEETVKYIKDNFPDIPVIDDAKRGDIGETNKRYAKAVFGDIGADAVTVNPYLGTTFFKDNELQVSSMMPFLEKPDRGVFVLCRTSNTDAGEFQDLPVDLSQLSSEYREKFGDMDELRELLGQDVVPLYQIIAFRTSRYWNFNKNVGLVVGATYPRELAQVRKIVGDMPILMPGLGSQGGNVMESITAGKDSHGWGLIPNSSSALIFPKTLEDEDERSATGRVAQELNTEIATYSIVQ